MFVSLLLCGFVYIKYIHYHFRWLHLFSHTLMQIFSQAVRWQQGRSSNQALKWGKKGCKWFWISMIVGCSRWAFLSISDLLGFSLCFIKGLQRMVCEIEIIQWAAVFWVKMSWGQRRMASLLWFDSKGTVTQITSKLNQRMEKSLSWTLKRLSYSSRRPRWVTLLSAKKRKTICLKTIHISSPKLHKRRLGEKMLVLKIKVFKTWTEKLSTSPRLPASRSRM